MSVGAWIALAIVIIIGYVGWGITIIILCCKFKKQDDKERTLQFLRGDKNSKKGKK